MIRQSAVIKRALIGYDEEMIIERPFASQSTKV